MLVEISVTNYRSICETQTLSLVKGRGDELVDTNTFEVPTTNGPLELLRSAAIYGPNAGGKSNLLKALEAMREVVVKSATNMNRGDSLPVVPFRLSPETRKAPSEFEVIFIVDGVRYQYGFAATQERIHEEWLFAFPKGRPQRWFHRDWSEKTQQHEWELGNNLTGERQTWQKATRDNALFLSTAVQLNSEQLQPVYDWFSDKLKLLLYQLPAFSHGFMLGFSAAILKKGDAIDDIQAETKTIDTSHFPDEVKQILREDVIREMESAETIDVRTVHKDSDGKAVTFDIKEESAGTQWLFSLSGPWLDVLENGYILCVDELHAHLHPELVKFLVEMFHSKETNPNNAQLIFNTHDTSVMENKIFRRDQIWFCEKGKSQATSLYPLNSFKVRREREKYGPAYLSGRYGAVPFIRNIKEMADG